MKYGSKIQILLTADLHYNHPRGQPLACELIDRMNRAGGDVLVVVGDTATAEGDALEQCLSRFRFRGPKLFVAGNHELWTRSSDSYAFFNHELPRRIRDMGWQWLETEPFIAGNVAIVGTVGWYDYSFAATNLGIPRRFYEAKVSPGAADRFAAFSHLFDRLDDIPPSAREVIARWNDGKFIHLGRSDEAFLQELLDRLSAQLRSLANVPNIIACVHHVPFRELLPPPHSNQWDFAKAFLGSERLGQMLLQCPNVKHVFCGHSHLPMEVNVGNLHAVNIGCGYRWKTFYVLDVPLAV